MRNWICYLVRSECSGHLDATGEMSQVVDGLHGAFDADKRGRIAIHDTAQTVTQASASPPWHVGVHHTRL